VSGTIVDAERGQVQFELQPGNLKNPGIYVAEVTVKDGGTILWRTQYWLEVCPSLDAVNQRPGSPRPVTTAEIRLVLRDVCADQNVLLQTLEFDDSQIAAFIRWPIDEFNEKYQPTTHHTASNFPFRYHWMRATVGYLLESGSFGYARDHFSYAAGGVSVDDKNKTELYNGLGRQLLSEWRDFIKRKKVELNISGGYGSLPSDYSYFGQF
jgi:hypothetical protein